MPKRTVGIFLLGGGIGAATLWYIIALIQDRPRWLRGEFWQWGRFTPELTPGRVGLLVGLAVIWLGVVYLALRPQTAWTRRRLGLLLLWAVLFTPAAQLVIAAQHRAQPLSVAFLTTTLPKLGFYYDGVRLDDPNEYIRQHVAQMPTYLGVHQRTQPFGWSLAFWAAWHVWEKFPGAADKVGQWLLRYDCTAYNFHAMSRARVASATLQMSLIFWSGLGALPLFWLGAAFYRRPPTGWQWWLIRCCRGCSFSRRILMCCMRWSRWRRCGWGFALFGGGDRGVAWRRWRGFLPASASAASAP